MNEADDKFTNFSVSTINDMTEGSITLTLVFSVITALTAIGNLLVVFAVLLVHKLRYPSNFLIVSLAASDLLVSIMVMPFSSYAEYKQRWDLGEVVCDMYILFDVLLCTASILNLCAISIDRYLAVTRPLEYVTKRTPKRMVIMIATAWISSALISIPPIFGFKDKFVPGACEYSKNFIYQIYACFGAFYLPLIVMLILYGRIVVLARRIVKSDRERLASCSASDDKRSSIQNYAESQETEDDSLLKKPHRFSSFITSLYCLTKGHRESMDSTEKSPESLYPVVTSLPTTVPASAPPQFNNPVVSITEANHSPERSPYPDPGHHFSRLPPHLTRHLTEDSHFNGHPLTSTRRASSNIYTKQQRKSLYPGNVHARIQLPPRIRASSFALGNLPTGSKNTLQGNMKQRFSAHVKKPRIRRSNETKAIRTLGVIMGVFCICWLPFFIVALGLPLYNHIYKTDKDIDPKLRSFFLWLGYVNSTLNPLIYAIFNRDFRQPFWELLKCHCLDINARLRERRYHHEFGTSLPPTAGDGNCGRPFDTPTLHRSRNSTLMGQSPHPLDRRRSSMLTE